MGNQDSPVEKKIIFLLYLLSGMVIPLGMSHYLHLLEWLAPGSKPSARYYLHCYFLNSQCPTKMQQYYENVPFKT